MGFDEKDLEEEIEQEVQNEKSKKTKKSDKEKLEELLAKSEKLVKETAKSLGTTKKKVDELKNVKEEYDIKNADDDDIEYSDNLIFDEEGNVIKSISQVFHESMLPYSEYVILDRALPRIEDGLKPVQRRILYSMYDTGLTSDKPFKKCAKVVGEVIANYHPHGDSSIYNALVRLAQPFNMGQTLVHGYGNFGSIDGDSAAAMRYTECKLMPLASELLRDIEKDTVKWSYNFDDTRLEPDILPSRFPNILVNGATGIAVGLATNFPTHNLAETIDLACAYIDNNKMTVSDMMKIVKGPDFPTGGIVLGYDELVKAYETGKGKITVRAKTEINQLPNGKTEIVIHEFPYQVNKSECLRKISELKEQNKDFLGCIADIRDESDKQGIRAVIILKAGSNAEKVLNYLYKYSDLQVTFGINMVAIAGGKPQLLNLPSIMKYYTEYQKEVVFKRAKYDYDAAKDRAHILEGLIVAIENIDTVIKLIKKSASTSEARVALMEKFNLTEVQAQAILDMRLARLTNLEVYKLQEELKQLNILMKKLKKIIESEKLQYEIVKNEMQEIKAKYKSPRKTQILKSNVILEQTAFVEEKPVEDVICCIGHRGNIKRMSMKSYNMTGRIITENSSINEAHLQLIEAKTNQTLYLFTDFGNCFTLKVGDIHEAKWREKGDKIHDLIVSFASDENVVKAFCFDDELPKGEFIFYTKDGTIKKTDIQEYNVKKQNFIAIKLKENDKVINVEIDNAKKPTMFFVTKEGMALNSNKNDLPLSTRLSQGVKGILLKEGDYVIMASSVSSRDKICLITSNGYGKQVETREFEILARARKGVKVTSLTQDTGNEIAYAEVFEHKREIMVTTKDNNVISVINENLPLEERTKKGKIIKKGSKLIRIKSAIRFEWEAN